jgi:hypothetical protein
MVNMQVEGKTMSAADFNKDGANHAADAEQFEFNIIAIVVFAICFLAIAFARIVPRRWRWNVSGNDENKSIVGAAKAAVYGSIPFTFM